MHLTEEQIGEFKELYKARFGRDLSDTEARESATDMVRLVKAVYKPVRKQDVYDLFVK